LNEVKILTPIKAIRAKCMDCSNQQYSEVTRCPIINCSLYPYRFGKRPKNNTGNIKGQEQAEN